MFVYVGFTPSADSVLTSCTADAPYWDQAAEALLQSALIPGMPPRCQSELKTALGSMPFETQMRWVNMLKARIVQRHPLRPCPDCGRAAEKNISFGASPECPTCPGDLAIPEVVTDSDLRAARAAQIKGQLPGDDCVHAISTRFSNLCSSADRLVAIDRFALADASRDSGSENGLRRLIDLASRSGVPTVVIYVCAGFKVNGNRYNVAQAIGLGRSMINATPGTTVTLNVLSERDGRKFIHDRWLGFFWGSSGAVSCSLGKGLSQFSGRQATSFHALSRQDDSIVASIESIIASRVVGTETI